jgi:hypothetical protein
MPGPSLLAVLALAGWGPGACGAPAPVPAASLPHPPCTAVEGSLPAGARADGLEGEFRLTLVATRGARTGGSTSGTLHLRRNDVGAGPAAAEGVRYPLYGGAELSLDSVGAVAPGDIGSTAAARPGVLVIEWRRAGQPADRDEIILRFGTEANAEGPQRFDGAHLSLFPATLTAGRFAGRWDSGTGQQQASGHFCAERVAAAG